MKRICYYHRGDMDGITSGAIIKYLYPECEMVGVEYGDDLPLEAHYKDSILYLLDFSFDPEVMNNMEEKTKEFIWCDHHITAKEKNPRLWIELPGERSLDFSGAELTWIYINRLNLGHKNKFPTGNEMPTVIKLIGDYDLWKFENSNTKDFNEGIKDWFHYSKSTEEITESNSWDVLFWTDHNSDAATVFAEICSKGQVLCRAKQSYAEKTFKEGQDIKFENYNTRIMNANNHASEVGNYAVKQDYDIGMMWSVRDGKIIISLRSLSGTDVHVGNIAAKYGGGGHKHAAGFQTDLKFIRGLYDE